MTVSMLAGQQAADDLGNVLSQTVWRSRKIAESAAWRSCLCMLVPALDPRCKTFKVIDALPQEVARFDRIDFLNTMTNLGYFARSERLNLCDIDPRLMPCLFIPDDTQEAPCVLVAEGGVYDGERKQFFSFPQEAISGEAWFFTRFNEDKTAISKNVRAGTGYSWFRALLGRFHGTIWHVLAIGLVLNLFALATPLFIMLVYDHVLAAHAPEILPMLAVGVGFSLVIEWMLRSVRSGHLSSLAGRLDNIVSNRIFSHLLQLSPEYIERASVPSQIARIKAFESVRDFFSGSVFLSLLEMPFMIVALIAIAAIAGPLAMVPVFMSVLYVALFYYIWRKVKVAIRTSAKAASMRQQFSLETIDKIEAINSNGLSPAWSKKFHEIAARDAITAFQLSWLGIIGETLANALTVLSAVAVVGFGVDMIWTGQITTGALVATMILVWRILTPFYSLCTMVPRLDQLRNSLRQVNNLMDVDTENTLHRSSARISKVKGHISFINVGMRYSAEGDMLFSGLSFEAMPGDIVAVTGQNGAGKTSLLKLVKGLYTPQSGSLRVDGFDIRQLDPASLRRQIAYVPQQASFFEGTIAENLRFANPIASDKELEMALAQAGVLEEIKALPKGLDTVIGGENRQPLSSSLELRLSLVRAYLHDAQILLVDELPNSMLSEEAGQFLRDHLIRFKRKRTVIMVTHREDFMEMADTVVVLRRNQAPLVGPRQFILDQLHKKEW